MGTDVIVHGILDAALKIGAFAFTSYVKTLGEPPLFGSELANETDFILPNATNVGYGVKGDAADLTEDSGDANATARTRIHSLDCFFFVSSHNFNCRLKEV